jgi:hypothetical protein
MGAESGDFCCRFLLPFALTLDKGLIQNPCRPGLGPQFGPAWNFGTGSPFWTLTPPLPSLYLLISVSSNDLMDQTYVKAASRLRDKMASPFIAFPDFLQRSI